jgi:GNAT superfamily N-acetyltransferase
MFMWVNSKCAHQLRPPLPGLPGLNRSTRSRRAYLFSMVDSPIIRKGELFDIDAVKSCIEEAYASYTPRIGKRPASMDTDFKPLLSEGHVWILEVDRAIVGLMVLIEEPDSFEIRSVAVLRSHQRRGLGRRLMSHAEKLARETGRSTLRLYTNAKIPELVTYYAALGYSEEARKQDRGYDRVFMVKSLRSDVK